MLSANGAIFHDISAFITLSTDNLNADTTTRWVIYFDHEQSGIWIRSGTGNDVENMKGILTLNGRLSETIVDKAIVDEDNDEVIERVYTKMYIQWNADSHSNYMRIGFGHNLGQDIIASVKFDAFGFSYEDMIKYAGFARALGSPIPNAEWKIYTNNLPSFCLSRSEKEKIHETQNSFNHS